MTKLLLAPLMLGLAACASTPPPVVGEAEAKQIAFLLGATKACSTIGLMPESYHEDYAYASARYLSTRSYDQDFFWQTFEDTVNQFADSTQYVQQESCAMGLSLMPARVSEMQYAAGLHRSATRAPQATAQQVPPPAAWPVYAPPPVPMPSNQPTFGASQNDTTHIYENGSIRSCTTTSSGVVVCQ